ncbi:hypothetical protein M9H77_16251 [Catharanthus roseus]|uniref:Uncharacterized protein n=1 Tax=Catharanthus roseus TaxID=4058 RepID=A0ACC0B1A4_CATRO|nr:hypothetical protein M9H77_16251 [Catharanthus roseus]
MSLNSVQVVDLSYNRFSGEIPSSDSLPRTLKALDLSSNEFKGEIGISFLQTGLSLMNFNVSFNNFFGQFPLFICNFLPLITVLDFSFNNFNGPIGFGKCSNLKALRAGFNLLEGPLPDDLYGMEQLEELYLPGNRLSGLISEGIGNLQNLRILALHENELSGSIPWTIGRLNRLENLLLYVNKLEGSLPKTLRNCSRLTTLNLRTNFIRGELSSFDFSKFLKLRIIDLGNNFFNGTFPATLGSCLSLSAIRLSGNQLVGEIPKEIKALQSLRFLSVSNNSLVNIRGALSVLSGCPNLTYLALSNNFFKESFPEFEELFHFHGFRNMQLLALGGCRFNGKLPNWLSDLPKLKVLDLSQNGFEGELPGWLWDLPSLFYLDLSYNFFAGTLPFEFTSLPSLVSEKFPNAEPQITLELPIFVNPPPKNIKGLQYNKIAYLPPAIYLKNNNISGFIPSEVKNLKLLQELDLSNNHFSGNIPETISELKNLEELDLSGNRLQGRIPPSFRNLHFLSAFNVANNLLEGPVPTGGQFDTFPITSFQGNPDLCGEVLYQSCSENFATLQTSGKKTINWLSFQSGFGIGYSVSFVIAVVTYTYVTRCSWRTRKSRLIRVNPR